ncbi:MAG: hypothetical protein IH940_13345, partial [Acidobacteria bacterium]|nr:hypothetical protein [Acidobacteriota bacterium]
MRSINATPETTVQRLPVASSAADAEVRFAAVEEYLRGLGSCSAVQSIARYRDRLDAIEATALADGVLANGDATTATRTIAKTSMSRRERYRRVNRAKAVASNHSLADKVASGQMTGEHLDVIAGASNRTDGAAARASELIEQVAATTPDQASKIADEWVADRQSLSDVDNEHQRQRRLRAARRTIAAGGLESIVLNGDKVSIDAIWSAVSTLANRYYQDDGGRDLPADKHPRTDTQRRYDAVVALITNPSSDIRPSGSRPKIVITVPMSKLDGTKPDTSANQIGIG